MTKTLQAPQTAAALESTPESVLASRDSMLQRVIAAQSVRWPAHPTEDPIWGLVRIIMAQQISTRAACRIAERVMFSYPTITTPSPTSLPDLRYLRTLGLSERRAQTCITVLERSEEIRANVMQGKAWEEALVGVKGIGPWTLSVFRIMVLRDPDVLPVGDVGLERAVVNVYGKEQRVANLGETWRPFRSVACWYLWRTLGNEQLG